MASPNTPGRLLVDLAKAYALSEFYPLTHPTHTQAVLNLAQALLSSGELLSLRCTPAGKRTVGLGGVALAIAETGTGRPAVFAPAAGARH